VLLVLLNFHVGILGFRIAEEFNLVTFIDGLPT